MAQKQRGFSVFLLGTGCVLAALVALILVAQLDERGACLADERLSRCLAGGSMAALVGLFGLVLMLRHVATPGHD
jgi:hypothetical protein